MPDMDGVQILEKMRERNIKIPIIVITADVQSESHKLCTDLGAVAVINKPLKKMS